LQKLTTMSMSSAYSMWKRLKAAAIEKILSIGNENSLYGHYY
jgi:hypothetical protein